MHARGGALLDRRSPASRRPEDHRPLMPAPKCPLDSLKTRRCITGFGMKRQWQLCMSALVLVAGLESQSAAQDGASIRAETAQQVDTVFAAWDNTRSPGCALGVSQSGNVVYSRGYGMSNLEYDVAITPDSIFQVGSISKQFTAFAIGLLASDGSALGTVTFVRAPSGATTGLTITMGGVRRLSFTRVEK